VKLLFVQLPLHDHSHSYIQGNVEYAPAAMAAYLGRNAPGAVSFEFLPFLHANFSSNRVIARHIVSIGPDIVSFTTYLWNLERNLHIAALVKETNPDIKIIFGGPEITDGSFALNEKRVQVDLFVHGEGEWFFKKFVSGDDISRYSQRIRDNTLVVQPDNELLPAGEIVEPFTNGYLNSMMDGGIFLELTRGCPYKCSYCYYSKNSAGVRELPIDTLLKALSMRNFDLSEIYILSPTFNRSRSFRKNLDRIAEVNPGIRLHTEMRADGIDDELAGAIYRAGFRSLETGLQTLTPVALKSIGRRSSVRGELDGMRRLKEAGIDLKVGVIPGLPGDTPERFMRTVETLAELGFEENIELYPLMLLPGTRIRDMAESAGAVFQRKPPYYLLEGWNFSRDSFGAIVNATTGLTGLLQHRDSLPDFSTCGEGLLTCGAIFDGRNEACWDGTRYHDMIDTAVFSFHIEMHDAGPDYRLLRKLIAGLPHDDQLYTIILQSNHMLNQEMVMSLKDISGDDTIHHRLNIYCEGKDRSTVRFLQVFTSARVYSRACENYYSVIPILKIEADTCQSLQGLKPAPENLLVGKNAYRPIKDHILRHYRDSMENIAFEDAVDMTDFYRSAGADTFPVPDLAVRRLD